MTPITAMAFAAVTAASLAGLLRWRRMRAIPSRTIHIIVANAAGGGTDYLARLVGAEASGAARPDGGGREQARRQSTTCGRSR